jgi:hypothetical protein
MNNNYYTEITGLPHLGLVVFRMTVFVVTILDTILDTILGLPKSVIGYWRRHTEQNSNIPRSADFE